MTYTPLRLAFTILEQFGQNILLKRLLHSYGDAKGYLKFNLCTLAL